MSQVRCERGKLGALVARWGQVLARLDKQPPADVMLAALLKQVDAEPFLSTVMHNYRREQKWADHDEAQAQKHSCG